MTVMGSTESTTVTGLDSVNRASMQGRIIRGILLFTVVQALIVVLSAYVMGRFVWTDTSSLHAIQASAWLAFIVQTISFGFARLVAREQIIVGWGLGVLLRFAAVAFWALLGIKVLGLVSAPALISLVVFFFLSTLVEPLFLN